jgi:hypothetical protein
MRDSAGWSLDSIRPRSVVRDSAGWMLSSPDRMFESLDRMCGSLG